MRGARLKWWVFGVLLPLLPIGARVAAAWLDGAGTLGFVDLFGDGELLVLATVVAAAAIGDLVFDLRGDRRRDSRERLRIAGVHALALVVVVGSVLFFGLVTYANQTRADTLKRAQAERAADQIKADAAAREARQLELRARQLDRRRQELNDRRRRVEDTLAAEVEGQGPSGASGFGPFARRSQKQARQLALASARLKAAARALRTRSALQSAAATHRLTTSNADVDRGRKQAAVISVAMFFASLAAAFPAVGLTARDAAETSAAAEI